MKIQWQVCGHRLQSSEKHGAGERSLWCACREVASDEMGQEAWMKLTKVGLCRVVRLSTLVLIINVSQEARNTIGAQ